MNADSWYVAILIRESLYIEYTVGMFVWFTNFSTVRTFFYSFSWHLQRESQKLLFKTAKYVIIWKSHILFVNRSNFNQSTNTRSQLINQSISSQTPVSIQHQLVCVYSVHVYFIMGQDIILFAEK
jgi:hypothetical protein